MTVTPVTRGGGRPVAFAADPCPAPADPAPRPGSAGLTRPAVLLGLALAVALAGALAASVLLGSVVVPPEAVLEGAHPLHAISAARVDRTLLALAVGAALGLAGACMQGLTRNPLADPGLLGVNAGASLAVVLAIAAFGASALPLFIAAALLGATVAALLVHGVASLAPGGATPLSLVVTGAAVTAAASSLVSAILLTDRSSIDVFRAWQVGTVGGRDGQVLLTGLPVLLVGAALALGAARALDALALGDDSARGLGRRTTRDRVLVGLAVVLLAGGATALAGPIAFVGLMAPHVVRAAAGPRHGVLLSASAVVGATVVLAADTLGRVVLPPVEVQVGIMTAVVGVPIFLLLVARGRRVAL